VAVHVEDLEVRQAEASDRTAIIALCERSLDWRAEDPNEAFYAWKHDENPWGPSPAWIASTPGGRIVGLRTFLRWRFDGPGQTSWHAVRAVDTATDPEFQGRGIFSRLTLGALPHLAGSGVDFIFNTPNDRSRPGYYKMGWQLAHNIPAVLRPRSPGRLWRIARSRSSAELWSEYLAVGRPIEEILELDATTDLLEARNRAEVAGAARTSLSVEHLRWRYGFEPLRYRAVAIGKDPADGFIVVRLRRRAAARELVVALVLGREGMSPQALSACIARTIRAADADHALTTVGTIASDQPSAADPNWRALAQVLRCGFMPMPGLGPTLTTRDLREFGAQHQPPSMLVSLGDIELF
jgi:GNAT superfamily N-acetyltransferase